MAESDAPLIIDRILEGAVPEIEDGLFISDLVIHAREFELETRIVAIGDGLFPCIQRREGTFAPISFAALGLHWAGFFPFSPSVRDFWLRGLDEAEGISFVPIQQARQFLRTGMIEFLGSRIRSLFDDDPQIQQNRIALRLPKVSGFGFSSLRLSTSGFNITVSAVTSGLRIHSSPTFRRSWSYFGSPTSPIINALPGGIYEFGADGGGYTSITPDGGTFDIPYKTTKPSLNL